MKWSVPIGMAAQQLQDLGAKDWTVPVLLGYGNMAVREIIKLRPTANLTTGNIDLVAGSRQSKPATAVKLLDITRNMGTGAAPGRAITKIEKAVMDSALPDWNSYEEALAVQHVIMDGSDPDIFYTFPPQPEDTTQKVEGVYSTFPTKATNSATEDFPLADEYETNAIDYMIFRALKEETTIPNAQTKADSFYKKFLSELSVG